MVTSYVGAGRRFIRSLIGMGDVDGIVVKGCGLGGVPAAMFVLVALSLTGGMSPLWRYSWLPSLPADLLLR